MMNRRTVASAAYIHIPFCRAKCSYCDFNSYAGRESIIGEYVDALLREIASARRSERPLDSVYLGGGTPTLLAPSELAKVVESVEDHLGITDDAEVTIEANPGTVDRIRLERIRRSGFNRLSIGVQSFDDDILRRIGRIHTREEARTAFREARRAGFENISIDLMYALPVQSLSQWESTLRQALELRPEHVSLYELTVEEGTAFGNLRNEGRLSLPDEDRQIEMYVSAIRTLESAGYEHYEISNFALPGRRSRHNQVYWRNDPYYGFGAGATGYLDGVRYTNLKPPENYISAIAERGTAIESSETVEGRQSMGETIMLGLRMLDGLDLEAFGERYGVALQEAYSSELAQLIERGLLVLSDDRLRLTWEGLLIGNEVAAEFL